MQARLYCKHCEKYYNVPLNDVRLMQETKSENITFTHNTYYYEDEGCFFKTIREIKSDAQETGASA